MDNPRQLIETPPSHLLFSSDLWKRALESYANAAQLTVKLFDAQAHVVLGPIRSTALQRLFEESNGYEPGIFGECARRCLAQQPDHRQAMIVSEFYGLAVVGVALILDGQVVGAAVGGYAFVDFMQFSEVERLSHDSGVSFEQLWRIAREQAPIPRRRLMLNGELLQILGDAILKENSHTRQYGSALTQRETQLRALTAKLLTSQEDERRRLARELHDGLMQRFSGLLNQLARLRLTPILTTETISKQLEDIEKQVESISDEMRTISHGLHPSILDDLGLEVATRHMVHEFASRASQNIAFEAQNISTSISPLVATVMYRVAQEALENARKHAKGASVLVVLSSPPGELRLVVEDDGPGFDVNATQHTGIGLTSMRERAHLIGGRLKITSAVGQGTRTELVVPWTQNA